MTPGISKTEMTVDVATGKRPTFLENFSFYFTEYCDGTTIHGFKFLGERGRYRVERLWWVICIIASLCGCMVFIKQTYLKWETSPVIVTFATTETPIWKIPFPSITVCPQIKSKRNIYNYTRNFLAARKSLLVDGNETNEFQYMSLLCKPILKTGYDFNISPLSNEGIYDFFRKVAPPIEEVIVNAYWLDEEFGAQTKSPIEQIFTPTLTSEGICYSFNILDRDEIYSNETNHYKNIGRVINREASNWTVESGYAYEANLYTFPKRTILAGIRGGLDLVLANNRKDVDPICGESLNGYKIVVQNPTTIPIVGYQTFTIPLNQYVMAGVTPKIMTTSDDLKYYSTEARQCYFNDEKKLRFFKIYNQDNCITECLANFTYNYCDCIEFYMPRLKSMPICGIAMRQCVKEAYVLFLAKEVKVKIQKTRRLRMMKNPSAVKKSQDCNCLPSCHSLNFYWEISAANWDWRELLDLANYSNHLDEHHFTRLKIFFKDMQFITSERNQLYGYIDFWANCGGLFGLFTGFSFISLAELLYFGTLRLVCNVRKFGRHYWSGSKELVERQV